MWLKARDRNTKFVHKHAKQQLWRNNVNKITTSKGITLSYYTQIKEATIEHFANLYRKQPSLDEEAQASMLEHIHRLVSSKEIANLIKSIIVDKVWEPLDSFGPNKAPHPNGFLAHFYKVGSTQHS